jgi:hypothetical protein
VTVNLPAVVAVDRFMEELVRFWRRLIGYGEPPQAGKDGAGQAKRSDHIEQVHRAREELDESVAHLQRNLRRIKNAPDPIEELVRALRNDPR